MKIVPLIVLLCFFPLTLLRAQTQDPQFGEVPYQAYTGSDFDKINLFSGLLTFEIPLYSFPQRGGKISIQSGLRFNSKYWTTVTNCTPDCDTFIGHARQAPSIAADPSAGYYHIGVSNAPLTSGFSFVQDGTARVYSTSYRLANGSYGIENTPTSTASYSDYQFMTSDGSMHPVNSLYGTTDNLSTSGAGTLMTVDGTAWHVPSGGGIHDRNGVVNMSTDADGNTTANGDTMGRDISSTSPTNTSDYTNCTGSLPIVSASTWRVPAPNGSYQTYKICYGTLAVSIPQADVDYPGSDLNTTQTVLQSIVLPDNQTWTFTYDARGAGEPSSVNYGEISQITLPTGGTISYQYDMEAAPSGQYSAYVISRTVYDGTTSRTWHYQDGYTSVETDPDGNVTQTTYNYGGAPLTVQSFNNAGSLLKEVDTAYADSLDAITPSEVGVPVASYPISVTTTLASGAVSKKTFSYCCVINFENFGITDDGRGLHYGGGASIPVNIGVQSGEQDYDYGNGAPGPLLKSVATTFLWQTNPSYLAQNLLDTPVTITTSDGSGSQVAKITYTYDEPSYLTTSGIGTTFGHQAPAVSGVYGHVTTTTRWLSGGSDITTHTSWFDTGLPYQMYDALNQVAATYQYDATTAWALPTSITLPNGTYSYLYDLAFNQETQVTDPNQQASRFHYDYLARLTESDRPDGGQTTYCYKDDGSKCSSSAPLFSFSIQKALAGAGASGTEPAFMNSEIDFDGLGRKIQSKLSAPEGTQFTDTTYDDLGRVASVSNPYLSTSDSTYGVTSYTYDALGRKVTEVHPDGGVVRWCYDGVAGVSGQVGCYSNASTLANVSWVDATDENGNHIQHLSDGLGRLVGVMEPDPSSGTLALETDYTYNTRGDLTNVNQKGTGSDVARTRSFTYDTVSRLLTSNNPETGQITYQYDPNSNLTQKTDARNVTIHYGYDTSNRLTSKTYTGDGDGVSDVIAASTPPVGYVYGSASDISTNRNGRLKSEYTGSVGSPITQRTINAYDAVGRVAGDAQCGAMSLCGASPYTFQYFYDKAGNVTSANNGLSSMGIGLTYSYDGASRLQSATSTWDDATHPGTLVSGTQYGPAGLSFANLGTYSTTSDATYSLTRAYDNRLRIVSEADATTAVTTTTTTTPPASATITFMGGDSGTTGAGGGRHICTSGCILVPDSGTITVTLTDPSGSPDLFTASIDYDGEDDMTLASELAAALTSVDSSSTQTAGNSAIVGAATSFGPELGDAPPQAVLTMTALTAGSGGDYLLNVQITDSDDYPYSVSGAALVQTPITNSTTMPGTPIYSYAINSYTPNGNILSVTDSVMGTWAYTYDKLNRLSSGQASANAGTSFAPYGTGLLNWTYDSFGNFLSQSLSGSSPAYVSQGNHSFPTGDNHALDSSYDADGNVLIVQGANLTYDAEDRIVVAGSTQYVYDAGGNRVAKGTLSGSTFTPTNVYLLGLGGEQVSEVDGSGNWLYTNAYAGGKQLATYDSNGLHFHFDDWLGTRRLQASATGTVEESCQSLPFGDSVNCFNPTGGTILAGGLGADTTEQHFTGKERDTESGLDYFGARMYSSSMGRFMSPDWAAKAEPVPYAKLDNPQSLNLYAYVNNNPLRMTDPDGHDGDPCKGQSNCTSSVNTKAQTVTTTVTQTSKPVTTQNADGSSVTRSTTTSTSVTVSTADANRGQVLGGSQTSTTTSTYTNQLGGSITETSNPVTQPLSPTQVQTNRPNQLGALEQGVAPSAMQNIQKHPFTAGASGVGLAGGVITGVACAVGEPCGAIVLTGAGLAALGGALGLYGVATQK